MPHFLCFNLLSSFTTVYCIIRGLELIDEKLAPLLLYKQNLEYFEILL